MTRGQIARRAMIAAPSLWVAYDVVTSASSTAGIAFVFWPIVAGVILGVVIGIGAGVAYLDDKRWP